MEERLQEQLRPLREKIDALDAQILALLNQRAQTAQAVGLLKEKSAGAVLRPAREAQVIARLQALNEGPLPSQALSAIWTEVMSACRGLESQSTVAFLGPTGTFSEQATIAHFGQGVELLPCSSIDEVFRVLAAGTAAFGMVPVENSTEGSINRTLDLLLEHSIQIVGERSLRIRHNLLAYPESFPNEYTAVSAHPQALAQCQNWLSTHYPQLERIPAASNAQAALQAARHPHLLAIASMQAAQTYGLRTIRTDIQDDPQNQTRFLALGNLPLEPSGKDKTSIILAVPNRAGAVFEMLKPLVENGVSMTKFESRPARTGQWEYYFYIDLEGHASQPAVHNALQALQSECAFYKFLGSYPSQSFPV